MTVAANDLSDVNKAFHGPKKSNDKSPTVVYPLLRLVPYLRRYPFMLGLTIVAVLVASLATLALPFAIRNVIDLGFLNQDRGVVDSTFFWVLILVLVLALGSALRFYCAYWLGERLVADLKRDVFTKLISMSGAFFDRNHSGEIMSHLSSDTTLLNTTIRAYVSQALRNIVVMIGGIIMMIISSPSLSFMVICAIPLVVLPLVFYGRLVRKLSQKAQESVASLHKYGAESLSNIVTVQSHHAEGYVRDEFTRSNEMAVDVSLVRTKARGVLTGVAIFLVMASIVFILWYGARDVIAGNMSGGELVQFMLYAVFAAGSMGALTEIWGEIAQAAGATDRLSGFLDMHSDVQESQMPHQLSGPLKGSIEFQDVCFSYPLRAEEQVLRDISFKIDAGSRVAIVGASGAGKSTLFHLLLRFYDPVDGHILLDGVDIRDYAFRDLRGGFALVSQEPSLFDGSIYQNIAFAQPGASHEDVVAAAIAAEAHDFIESFEEGYETPVGEGGQSLSGGQRQRIALARALLRDAPLLLLDEATSNLDASSEARVQAALGRLMQNRTSLIIAHRLSTVIDADRILVLDGGRLVEQGTHSELMALGGVYASLAQTQLQTEPVPIS